MAVSIITFSVVLQQAGAEQEPLEQRHRGRLHLGLGRPNAAHTFRIFAS